MSMLKDEDALIAILGISKELKGKKYIEEIKESLDEMEEVLIKEYLFRIKEDKNIEQII